MMFLMDKIRSVHEKCAGDLFHQNRLEIRTAQMDKLCIVLKDLFSVALELQNHLPFLYQKHVNMILLLSVQLPFDLLSSVYLRVPIRPMLLWFNPCLKFCHQNQGTYSDLLYLMHSCGSLDLLLRSTGLFLFWLGLSPIAALGSC